MVLTTIDKEIQEVELTIGIGKYAQNKITHMRCPRFKTCNYLKEKFSSISPHSLKFYKLFLCNKYPDVCELNMNLGMQ